MTARDGDPGRATTSDICCHDGDTISATSGAPCPSDPAAVEPLLGAKDPAIISTGNADARQQARRHQHRPRPRTHAARRRALGRRSPRTARRHDVEIPDERLRHLAECIHRLGPYPLYHLLRELSLGAPLAPRLEAYGSLSLLADVIAELGGRDLPRPRIVGAAP